MMIGSAARASSQTATPARTTAVRSAHAARNVAIIFLQPFAGSYRACRGWARWSSASVVITCRVQSYLVNYPQPRPAEQRCRPRDSSAALLDEAGALCCDLYFPELSLLPTIGFSSAPRDCRKPLLRVCQGTRPIDPCGRSQSCTPRLYDSSGSGNDRFPPESRKARFLASCF